MSIAAEDAHPDDQAALEQLRGSLQFDGSRYVARLPWKAAHPALPINYRLAQRRLASNLKRLRNDPNLFHHYDMVMQEQTSKGFVEKVQSIDHSKDVCHFLPHHAVRKESDYVYQDCVWLFSKTAQ